MLPTTCVRPSARIALSGAHVGALAAGRLFLSFGLLIIVGVLTLIATTVANSTKALVVVARCRTSLTEAVIAINLLELRAKAFFCFGWREELLQLLNGLSDFVLVTCVISESNAKHPSHVSQVLNREMEVFMCTSSRSTER